MKMNSINVPGYPYRIGAEISSLLENTSNVFQSQLNLDWQYWLEEKDWDEERGGPVTFNIKVEVIDWLDEREFDYIYDIKSTSLHFKLKSDVIAFKLTWG